MRKKSMIIRLLRDNSAASAIEYGLILTGLSLGIIVAAQGLAVGLGSVWDIVMVNTSTALSSSSG